MNDTRPCRVKGRKAKFHQWVIRQEVVGPGAAIGSHQGGQIQCTFALVEFEDGTVQEVYPENIVFIDNSNTNSSNEPLTLEELREMKGMPVWAIWTINYDKKEPYWMLVHDNDVYNAEVSLFFDDYSEAWLAYRQKLEEQNAET